MNQLEAIFSELGISHYLGAFVDQGFDTWETILDITESDLWVAPQTGPVVLREEAELTCGRDVLGVKLGHRRVCRSPPPPAAPGRSPRADSLPETPTPHCQLPGPAGAHHHIAVAYPHEYRRCPGERKQGDPAGAQRWDEFDEAQVPAPPQGSSQFTRRHPSRTLLLAGGHHFASGCCARR